MAEADDAAELLFFDTFSHEVDTDINLDLVQFPKPVYITQVRIIPLGARVQADFPGGVRLGATNPSKFGIEFFVNDLGIPGASTFENLGHLEYNQNDCIHLECNLEKIPTDGLVLRGWYSTITLAVYGILTNTVTEQIASPPPPPLPPLEPVAPEEVCSVSSATAPNLPLPLLVEEPVNKAWKEPLLGEASHSHKSIDYERERERERDREREDLDFAISARESVAPATAVNYHQSEDERERRMRKASHSSDLSASRNRTLSESNERDFLRSRSDRERDRERDRAGEKDPRDWSRSPDYQRRSHRNRSDRSRSDAEDGAPKWPRTPPTSIDSPTRPRSPDPMDYDDSEDVIGTGSHYKMKSLTYIRDSNESLTPHTTTATQDLTAGNDDDENPGTPGEQFEPILSDDEIIGDENESSEQAAVVDEYELEIDLAASNASPAIKEFDPFKMPLQRFESDLGVFFSKEFDKLSSIFKKFEQQPKIATLELYKASSTNTDERENFVYLGEQLINLLLNLSQNFTRRNFVLKHYFKLSDTNLEQAFNILRIGMDFEAACLQPQPAFKIRHIKIGALLMELLGSSAEFIEYLLQVQKFEPFAAVFQLYEQEFMAMSIKLMLLKAVYALLDTKSGIQTFTTSKVNGYHWLLQHIQQTPLTRTKYALKSILRKVHLNESLDCIRNQCFKRFVLQTEDENHADFESFKLIELCILQLMDAFVGNVLSYQQPRRFLPVSKKFEVVVDSNAQRCYANTLQSYFNTHALAECLLLLFSNAVDLPATLLMSTLDLLQALLQTQIGIDYFVDDCFETTKLLVALLLGIEDVQLETQILVDENLERKEEKNGTVKEEEVVKSCENQDMNVEKVKAINTDKSGEQNDETNATEKAATKKDISTDDMTPPSAPVEIKVIPGSVAKNANSQISIRKTLFDRLQKLGIELAYKIQTRYHLDAIVFTAAAATATAEYDAITLASHLHALYSQTCNAPGRQYTIDVIGSNNNLQIFMDLIKKEQRLQTQQQLATPGSKYKSPVLSYAIDMVDCCVRHCENLEYLVEHGAKTLELAKNHDNFESSASAVLQEMFIYLRPLEVINIFAYDDITPLVEAITRSLEYITTFPGDLIMGLRILHHLAIGRPTITPTIAYKNLNHTVTDVAGIVTADTEELRHRFVLLQFYALDGVQILTQILEKLCCYFEQPGLHAPSLITIQGTHCCQIILPTLQILREMLAFAIQCRDVEFKDVTAIDHLMKTYFLMHYLPDESPSAVEAAQARKEIIKVLLSYTQPNEQDVEFLHKSLWTQMVREVLKNVLQSPSTYIPGLKVLAELLPLPLPLPLPPMVQLQDEQTQRLITERKLWSAHLHPQSSQLAKLIETIAPTSFPQLADLLTRVCLQLADLAPNMTLLISKTITDLLCAEWTSSSNVPTQHLSRLLNFFSQLTMYPSVKSSALSILSGKVWDLFQAILCFTDLKEIHLNCQLFVHRILESFLDSEISLMSPQCTSSAEVNLASALPPKELIPRIAEAILTNLLRVDVTHEVASAAVRNLVILIEHDITFYHLLQQLRHNRSDFQLWLQKLVTTLETGKYNPLIETVILLLRSLMHMEEESASIDAAIPPRTLKVTPNELSHLLGYKKGSKDSNVETPHLLQRLHDALEQHKSDTETRSPPSSLFLDINGLIAQLKTTENSSGIETDEDSIPCAEPQLPQTEGIVTQYAARPIFTQYESSADETQLCSHFWLDPLRIDNMSKIDFDSQCERILCDLTELANTCLTADTNLLADCKRVLHLSSSPQSNRERTPTAPCFRMRRVEVEPTTGRPEKKIYITPVRGRGFTRTPPSRGDLFRSRPPNTSRPPSLHVDDFLALETCGAQPTGPTGYNKIPPLMRGSRVGRNRGSRIAAGVASYRKPKLLRTSSPSTWNDGGSQHYRSATSEPVNSHFVGDSHYSPGPPLHFGGRSRGRGGRSRSYLR